MEKHFLNKDSAENRIRYRIFQLMTHFEEMHALLGKLLSFSLTEDAVKDQFEEHFIKMEVIHKEMGEEIANTLIAEDSPLYEAIRRTYNHLTALNHLDLDKENWARIAGSALFDPIYYRQIKLIVF